MAKRKLTDDQAKLIWKRYYDNRRIPGSNIEYISMEKLAKQFKVSAGTVQKVLDRKSPYDKIDHEAESCKNMSSESSTKENSSSKSAQLWNWFLGYLKN